MILDPIGVPPSTTDTPEIALSGLTEITNDAGAEVTISVREGVLEAARWRDLYLLLHYKVVA